MEKLAALLPSPSEDANDSTSNPERPGDKRAEQGSINPVQENIVAMFLYYGREHDEALQWIRTALHLTRSYLAQSLRLIEPQRWEERYPSMSREEIHRLITSDTYAALWCLNGRFEEERNRHTWIPRNLTGATRTGTLVKYLTPQPDDPDREIAENRIIRLRKELERLSKQVRDGKITLPRKLKTAPQWQLIELGKKGKNNGHWVQPVNANTISITEAEKEAILEAMNSEFVTINDDEIGAPLQYNEAKCYFHRRKLTPGVGNQRTDQEDKSQSQPAHNPPSEVSDELEERDQGFSRLKNISPRGSFLST